MDFQASLEVDLRRRATFLFGCLLLAAEAQPAVQIIIVEGLPGETAYAEQFDAQVEAIRAASESLATPGEVRLLRTADATRDAVLAAFEELARQSGADDRVIAYLVGHGSFDDHDYKFNLPGPDLTGADIGTALNSLPTNEQLVVVTGSASGALAAQLGDANRTLVLATRSGAERHATRFGIYFAEALAEPAADTDKNQVITAAEAFDFAERRVRDYYERESRLATEHALLEGDQASRFPLARLATVRPLAIVDEELARLAGERDALNADIEALRLRRDEMPPEAYRAELLARMLELARLEDAIEAREQEGAR